ncbi:hypothetical protein NQ315_017206 [Exocentrus adspersus]|uniref:Uncharacterized protein n=1 Tax=Exocentrus adspersus TaxID=1586481 RepID=A0AAV8V985_9CUCU|nr:hypothetical protein NQ315_017206 [Exocentrus adspersus]
MYFKILVVLLLGASVGYSKRLPMPPYLKACARNRPDFDECCLRSGKAAIPTLIKGDKKYDIPNMLPLVIPIIKLESGPDFSLTVKDLHVYGLQTAELLKLKMDLNNKKLYAQVLINRLELVGPYDINGRILVIPLQGKGDLNVTIDGVTADYNSDFVLKQKEGREHMAVTNSRTSIVVKKAYLHLTNLFNGNKELGETTNKALNDNWEQVLDALRPVITETITKLVNSIADGLMGHISYEDMFSEK